MHDHQIIRKSSKFQKQFISHMIAYHEYLFNLKEALSMHEILILICVIIML